MESNKLNRSRQGWRGLGLLVGPLILLLCPARAWSWGCDGHQAIAIIAEKHMTPHALQMANQLLQSQPIDPTLSRFCSNQGPGFMADSSTWADDLRNSRPEEGPWHYIDIPRDAPRTAMVEACPASGCLTSALKQNIELLHNESAGAQARADALRFVIHFVGDVHQPLHCVTNDDEGGNCVPVDFLGNAPVEKNLQFESYTPNLHNIWDSAIILRLRGMETVPQWAASLDQQFGSQADGWQKQGVHVDDWAWDSHEIADTVVYARLPVAIPVEKPEPVKSCADDHHISTRMLNLHEQVAQAYVDAVAPTIDEQIAKAGVRLAMVLNQVWP